MKQLRNLLDIFLSFLFPKGKRKTRIDKVTPEDLITRLQPRVVQSTIEVTALFDYNDALIRDLIWAFKYAREEKVAQLFGEIVHAYLIETLADMTLFENNKQLLLVPIPISKSKLKKRGYNQAERVVEEVCRHDKGTYFRHVPNVMQKKKDTQSQVEMKDRRGREKNVKNTFVVPNPVLVKDAVVILLDDVVTTGSTLREAERTLYNAGARRVHSVVIAH